MPEVVDNQIRVPNPKFWPNPENYFDSDWGYRIITLDDAKGIKALIGKRKDTGGTAIRTYIFDRKKWTLAKAEAWVKEHVSASQELGMEMLDRGDISEEQAAEFDLDRGIALDMRIGNYVVQGAFDFPLAPKDTPWDWGISDEEKILGPERDDWEPFKKAHLLTDVSSADLPTNKIAYTFPVAKLIDGKLQYVWNGVRLVYGYLRGARGWTAPRDVKEAVYKTLSALHSRFDEGIGPLSVEAPVTVLVRNDERLEEKDGLIWKQLLRPGVWHKPVEEGTQKIRVTWQMIEDIKRAFDHDVMPHVSVPLDHVDAPFLNTGFVAKLEIRRGQPNPADDGLWCGIRFTEPDIEEKVRRGTIANISAYLSPNFPDTSTGKVWPWVLRHAALTNEPVVHLKPFMASLAMSLEASKTETFVEEVVKVDDKERQELESRIQAAEKRAQEAQQKMMETESKLSEVQEKASAYEREVDRHRRALHEMEVKAIMLALQGKGIHEKVKLPANCGFAPVVLSLVDPVLRADEARHEDIVLSLGSEEKSSVTNLILSILNSVAQANGGLVSFEPKGTQEHTLPGAEPTPEEKDKRIDVYFKDRGLGGD